MFDLWKSNLELLYSATFEYLYQKKFDGELPKIKHFKIQEYLDNLSVGLIDSSLINKQK